MFKKQIEFYDQSNLFLTDSCKDVIQRWFGLQVHWSIDLDKVFLHSQNCDYTGLKTCVLDIKLISKCTIHFYDLLFLVLSLLLLLMYLTLLIVECERACVTLPIPVSSPRIKGGGGFI